MSKTVFSERRESTWLSPWEYARIVTTDGRSSDVQTRVSRAAGPPPVISGEEEFVQIKFLQPSFSRPFSLQHPYSTRLLLSSSTGILLLAASFIRRNGFSFLPSFLFFFTLFPVVRVLNIRVILCFSSVSSFERGRGLIRCRATIKRCAPLAINPPLSRENIARIPREQCRRREAIGIFNTRFLLALPSILALEICRLIWNRMF